MNIRKYFNKPACEQAPRVTLVREGDTLEAVRADSLCTTYGKHYTVQKDNYAGGVLFVMCICGVHHITDAEVDEVNPSATFRIVCDRATTAH